MWGGKWRIVRFWGAKEDELKVMKGFLDPEA
jgi:hypothetical protein